MNKPAPAGGTPDKVIQASLAGLRPAATMPRASAFIVTIYGDAVDPRGGTLWIGSLINCCAEHGINESLVRTAVSRLVGAGRLIGDRVGRRSYYRLSPKARSEFLAASRVLFAPPPEAEGWLISFLRSAEEVSWPHGWARISSEVAIAPDREDMIWPDALVMRANTIAGVQDLPCLGTENWPLEAVDAAYDAFLHQYAPAADAFEGGAQISAAEALALRLRLVHSYRLAALSDPRLPRSAWPKNWKADAARRVFVHCYLALSEGANRHISEILCDANGPLPEKTAETNGRAALLDQEMHSK